MGELLDFVDERGFHALTPFNNAFNSMEHKDLIHQVEFDYYGRRLATCSSDMFICVWDRDGDGIWSKSASWKVHGGALWRVTWAHPCYGQVLASCSNDRSVYLWEETQAVGEENKRWSKKAFLADSRVSVTDVKFSPHHLGLVLIYYNRVSCIGWSVNQSLRPLIVIGGDDAKAPPSERLRVYELSDGLRKFTEVPTLDVQPTHAVTDVKFCPSTVFLGHYMAVAASDIIIYTIKTKKEAGGENSGAGKAAYSIKKVAVLGDLHGSVRLCWNMTGTVLTSSGRDGAIRVWKSIYIDDWKLMSTLAPSDYGEESLQCIAIRKGAMPNKRANRENSFIPYY